VGARALLRGRSSTGWERIAAYAHLNLDLGEATSIVGTVWDWGLGAQTPEVFTRVWNMFIFLVVLRFKLIILHLWGRFSTFKPYLQPFCCILEMGSCFLPRQAWPAILFYTSCFHWYDETLRQSKKHERGPEVLLPGGGCSWRFCGLQNPEYFSCLRS
jgi:hypothetical protein